MKTNLPIMTLDAETDPFLNGRVPRPFSWDLFDGKQHWTTWGKNCTRDMIRLLDGMPESLIYIHNGGKFDVFFLWQHINKSGSMLIIHERIVECELPCFVGHHLLRDSLKLLPFSLDKYNKLEIDYTKFEENVRESHKEEIIKYQRGDTEFLYQLVSEYFNTFGESLTIGATAMKELKKFHKVGNRIDAGTDEMLRPYFYGGRVQRNFTGSRKGKWKVYDVNSMYPYVMREFAHPIGSPSRVGNSICDDTFFVVCRGVNKGAFPTRHESRVVFDTYYGEYFVSIHEYRAAVELGLFDCEEIIITIDYDTHYPFDSYIDHFYALRREATDAGDKIHSLFFKFLLNNSYGKFATNPNNFKEYRITDGSVPESGCIHSRCANEDHFHLAEYSDEFKCAIWSRRSKEIEYMNVATGASITGAARATLMRGLSRAENVAYCDTDSIICEDMPGIDTDPSKLGAWKLEAEGNCLDIAGRKLYALWQDEECIKSASKGVRITPQQIREVALGGKVEYIRDAPTFHLGGRTDFISRVVQLT